MELLIILIFVLMRFTFPKEEKLKSRKQIGLLFEEGDSIKEFPMRLKFLKLSEIDAPLKVTFSVSKRNFKLAVDRIRIKRLLKESYRKNKHILFDSLRGEYICMFLYTDRIEWKQQELEKKMILILNKFKNKEKREFNENG